MSFFVARHFRSLFLFFDDDAVASPRSTVSRSTASSSNVLSRTTPSRTACLPNHSPAARF